MKWMVIFLSPVTVKIDDANARDHLRYAEKPHRPRNQVIPSAKAVMRT
jgi:hypothetical protein